MAALPRERAPAAKRVLLVRHGESAAQACGQRERSDPADPAGIRDAALGPLGCVQAGALGDALEALQMQPVELVVCSPLTRAVQTALLAFGDKGLPLLAHPGLREYAPRYYAEVGAPQPPECRGRPRQELCADPRLRSAELDWSLVPEGPAWWSEAVEPEAAFEERLAAFSEWLEGRPESYLAVVCHFHVIQRLLQVRGLKVKNCQPFLCSVAGREWSILEAGEDLHRCRDLVRRAEAPPERKGRAARKAKQRGPRGAGQRDSGLPGPETEDALLDREPASASKPPEPEPPLFVLEALGLPEDLAAELGRGPARTSNLRDVAAETLRRCEQGWYTNEWLEEVQLPLAEAVESTRLLAAGSEPPPPPACGDPSVVSVVQASTLAAAEALCRQGLRTCVLNFASAKNPGGGFLRGANAQEESLTRSSGLYACLTRSEVQAYYSDNQADGSCVYTDHMIMSGSVPVFRRDSGAPLEAPYLVSILTAPAPNMGVASKRPEAGGLQAIRDVRRRRMGRALAFMADGGFDAVVLGAWGCGVFGNSPQEVAGEFRELLCAEFRGAFPRVVFAICDAPTHAVFESAFSAAAPPRSPPPSVGTPREVEPRRKATRSGRAGRGGEKSSRAARAWSKQNAADSS